jgi:hypothetical protein
MRAVHCPSRQTHPPPQSSVRGRHSIVHMADRQSGARARETQAVAWQHVAGTQSASTSHPAAIATLPPHSVVGPHPIPPSRSRSRPVARRTCITRHRLA